MVLGHERIFVMQVPVNVLSNALKYTQPGTRIAVALEKGEFFHAVLIRNVVRMDLRAHVEKAFAEKIFAAHAPSDEIEDLEESFASREIPQALYRTGLGLRLSRRWVEKMGGKLQVARRDADIFEVKIALPARNNL
jgi:signal transduction histidine kinase